MHILFGPVFKGFLLSTHILFGPVFKGFLLSAHILFGPVFKGFLPVAHSLLGPVFKGFLPSTHSLGDAVAAANARLAAQPAGPSDTAMDISSLSSCQLFMGDNKENMPLRPHSKGDLSLQSVQMADDSIQSLIEKMHSSIEVSL